MKKIRKDQYTIRQAENNEPDRTLLLAELTAVQFDESELNESHAYASPEDFSNEAMFMITRGYLSEMMIEKDEIKTLRVTIIVEYDE